MVVAEIEMKPSVKVSVSDSESSQGEEGDGSEYDAEVSDASDQGGEDNKSDSGGDDDSDSGDVMVNEGWADSISKILSSTKPKNKKTLVLSRAKKFSEIKKEKDEKPTFEVIGESKETKPDIKKEEPKQEPAPKKRKLDRPSARVKPNILEKDRERLLSKIATKGVVQLFNAVRNQQKTLEKEMDSSVSETKKEKILKKFDKRTFLDTLMGNTKSVVVDSASKSVKDEVKVEEEKPKWNALRDDFMMGAKMKDWDKESLEE